MPRKIIKKALSFSGKLKRKSMSLGKRGSHIVSRRIERLKIKGHRYKTVEISISDLLLRLSRYGELLRCDIIVRLLAVENYYGKNDDGLDLYARMQDARVGEGYSEKAADEFKKLIRSYETNGYDRESGILLDKHFSLIDGSHRIALALYHHIPYITAHIVNSTHPVDYSIDWFVIHDFSTEETLRITDRYKEVLRGLDSRFSCVIWSPAQKYTNEILKDLKLYGRVETVGEHEFSAGEYENVVRAVYAIDDIEKWKIEKKIAHMQGYPPRLTCIDLTFDDPEYRLKASTGLLLSQRAERIKKAIRGKYQSSIPDYFFDIILHIGDNVYQSDYMRRIFRSEFDFREIISILDKYQYAFVKTDVPYMPPSFPDVIPTGKDADILCDGENMGMLTEEILDLLKKYPYFNIVRIDEPYGTRIRIQQGSTLYYQIDLSFKVRDMHGRFVEDALSERVRDNRGFYVISPEYEYIYRAYVYHENRNKKHHKQYLQEHRKDYHEELFRRYCDFSMEELVGK